MATKKFAIMKKAKPKLTDAERHARFVETARKVGADERPEEFDKAFMKLNTKLVPTQKRQQ
jgi:hypothetical protein